MSEPHSLTRQRRRLQQAHAILICAAHSDEQASDEYDYRDVLLVVAEMVVSTASSLEAPIDRSREGVAIAVGLRATAEACNDDQVPLRERLLQAARYIEENVCM